MPTTPAQFTAYFLNVKSEATQAAAQAPALDAELIAKANPEDREKLHAELITDAKGKVEELRTELTKAAATIDEPLHAEFTKAAEELEKEANDLATGVRTSQSGKLPESPEATYLRDLQDWYKIFFKARCVLDEFIKYCAEMRKYEDKTGAKLTSDPDKKVEPAATVVLTVATTDSPTITPPSKPHL